MPGDKRSLAGGHATSALVKGAATVGFRVMEMASCLYIEGTCFQKDGLLIAEMPVSWSNCH